MSRFGRKSLPLLPVLLFLLLHSPAWGDNKTLDALDGIAQAYGYVLGQELTLTRIADNYPSLAPQVEQARNGFDQRFPGIQQRLETQLRNVVGNMFPEIRGLLHTRMMQTVGSQPLSWEAAQAFLAEVRQRANGDIESPVLENLLAVRYADAPAREFLDGRSTRYETDGSGKALGVRLALQVPRSWAGRQDGTPNVVRKWRSENGNGPGLLQLMVFDATGWPAGNRDLAAIRRRGELGKLVPRGYRFHNSGGLSLGGQNGVWLETSGELRLYGVGVYQHALMYLFPYQGRIVQLLCSVGGQPNERRQIDAAFEHQRPLCGQVMDSVVLFGN